MGLAEPKRKVKYSLDPNALKWANDESKFGKRLMEKMGWEQGKGLGAKENGITENIKVKFKSDTKGVGFDNSQYENVWLDHQDDFESLLSNLNKTNEASNGNEQDQLQSLELKSKEAKGRLHYKKFAKSKDLTNASSHDLNCILGKEKRKKLKSEKNYETEAKQGDESVSDYEEATRVSFKLNSTPAPSSSGIGEAASNMKTSNELFSTNKLSLNDYFASKMANKFNKSQEKNVEEIEEVEKSEENDDEVSSKSKKKKKRKSHDKEIEEQPLTVDEEIVTKEKKKKKRKSDEQEKCEQLNDEEAIIKEEKKRDLEIDISKSFNGSNLHKIKGYSPYNITSSLETLMEEKAKRTQMKQAIVAKNLEKDSKFYEMKKK